MKAVKSKLPDGANNVEPLQKIPTPAIAHVIKNGKLLHYEVIYGVKKDKVQIMDPGTGELEWSKTEDFNKEWTGILVLLMPKDDFEQVKEAVEAGADIIMLDNMTTEQMQEAIAWIDHRAETECSGNVTKENIERLTALGVDYISSGALTHSSPIMDISMKNLHAI